MGEWFKLKDVCIGGGAYGINASAVEYSPNLPTYLRITDIKDDGTVDKSGFKSVDDNNFRKYILKPNDIVFARTGASTGRNYFYNSRDGEFVYAGFLIKFSLDSKKVNPLFIKYYCRTNEYFDWVQANDSGGTRGNINANDLSNMPIPYLCREQQDLLASILSSLDDKIDLLTRQNITLEAMAETLFRQWFVEEVNEEWETATLGCIANVTTGKGLKKNEFKEDGLYPVLGSNGVIGRANSYLYTKEDDLIVTGRVGTHGKVFLVNEKVWISDNVLIIKPKERKYKYALYFILKGLDYESLNVGSTQPLITQTDIKKQEIKNKNGVFEMFDKIVTHLFEKIDINDKQIKKLQMLRDTLLPKLMSGEVLVINK